MKGEQGIQGPEGLMGLKGNEGGQGPKGNEGLKGYDGEPHASFQDYIVCSQATRSCFEFQNSFFIIQFHHITHFCTNAK